MSALSAGLSHGAWLCGWMTLVVLGSLRHDPRIWQGDAPRAIKEMLGPIPPETRRRKALWGAAMAVGLIGISAALMVEVSGGWWARAVASYAMFQTFNVFDAVVIDIGVILLWAPAWAFAPGCKGHPALRDWRFHARAFAIGVLAGLPFAALVAGLAELVGLLA